MNNLCWAVVAAIALLLSACTPSPNPPPVKSLEPAKTATTAAMPPASTANSFCTAAETLVFTCPTGAKQVSVCASRTLSPTAGYVQYRFGNPGVAGAPLELAHPPVEVHPLKAAYGASVAFSGGGGAWLRFRNAPYAYVVYSGIGRWGADGATVEKQGLVVEKDGKRIAHLKCSGPRGGELGPDWFTQAGYAATSSEAFDFPD